MIAPLEVADLFCGAGGSSTGLAQACEDLNVEYSLTAVNHWDIAIATHTANHPHVNHLKAEVDKLKARALSERGYLDILWASPACTEHSYAKGGHSIDDQKRHSAWAIVREAERYRPKIIIVENVPPFKNWGPTEPVFHRNGKPKLDKKGNQVYRPIKSRRGQTYRAWFSAIESLGYTGRADLLNAADYGEPQSRIRLFMVFTAPAIDFEWPVPEFGPPDSLDVASGARKPWRGAREILDRRFPMESIFNRDKPLAENTLRRIAVGAQRFWGDPYLVILRRHADARGLNLPIPTVAAGGLHMGVAQPGLRPLVCSNGSNAKPRPDDRPGPTITAQGGRAMHLYVPELRPLICNGTSGAVPRTDDAPGPTVTAEDYQWTVVPELRPIVGANRTNNVPGSDDGPAPTVTTATGGGSYVAEPHAFVLGQQSNSAPRDVDDPMPTVTTGGKIRVAEPVAIVLGQHGGGVARSEDQPLSTVSTDGYVRVFEPVILDVRHGDRPHQPKTADEPLNTVTAKNGVGAAEAVIVSYAERDGKGSGKEPVPPKAASDPLGTVITRDRFGIAEPVIISYHGESANGGTHRPRTMDDPINTVDTSNRLALCEPTIEVLDSLPADAPKERIFQGTDGNLYLFDIWFRMLQPPELARAQGFPEDYVFTGSKEAQTAQIGNAVSVRVSKALLKQAILALRGDQVETAA